MKDFIIPPEELIVPLREGIIVDPQLKQTVPHSGTSHKTPSMSSLVVSITARETFLQAKKKKKTNKPTLQRALKMVVPHWFSAGGATAFILQWSCDSGWQEWQCREEHRNTHIPSLAQQPQEGPRRSCCSPSSAARLRSQPAPSPSELAAAAPPALPCNPGCPQALSPARHFHHFFMT